MERRIGEACRGRRERRDGFDGVGELVSAVREVLRRRVEELEEDGWMFEGGG